MKEERIDCRKAQELMDDLVAGDLKEEMKGLLYIHVSQCTRCETELKGIEGIVDAVKGIKAHDPGREFWKSFQAGVWKSLESQRGSTIGKWAFIPAMALAAAIAALVIRANITPQIETLVKSQDSQESLEEEEPLALDGEVVLLASADLELLEHSLSDGFGFGEGENDEEGSAGYGLSNVVHIELDEDEWNELIEKLGASFVEPMENS